MRWKDDNEGGSHGI